MAVTPNKLKLFHSPSGGKAWKHKTLTTPRRLEAFWLRVARMCERPTMGRSVRFTALLSVGVSVLASVVLAGGDGWADDAAARTQVECRLGDSTPAAALIAACDVALAGAADPEWRSNELLARAYGENDLGRYEAALIDLTEAVRLNPANAHALHERAYALNSLGRYSEALTDLDAQEKLTPNDPKVFQEAPIHTSISANWKRATTISIEW